jgi:D-inositol-3-phosphate glycosyltransferase
MKGPTTIIGTLPPVTGISPFCIGWVCQLASKQKVVFESIRSPYPPFFYPGTLFDHSSTVLLKALPKNSVVKNNLTWWNLLGWIAVASRINTNTVYLNWWTIALFPMLFTISCLLRLRGKRVICIVHNPIGHERYPADQFLTSLFFKTCHRFIVFTNEAKKYLSQQYGINNKPVVVQDHPPLNFYPHQKITKETARKQLNLPQNDRVYLCFGRIRQYKNLERIIKDFASKSTRDPSAILVLAGEPWVSLANYEKLINSLRLQDRVRLFLEYIPTERVPLFFRAADTFLLAHQDPGSGSGVIALAKSFNLPVLKLS